MRLLDRMIAGFTVGATVFAAPFLCAVIALNLLGRHEMLDVFSVTVVITVMIIFASVLAGVAYYILIDLATQEDKPKRSIPRDVVR